MWRERREGEREEGGRGRGERGRREKEREGEQGGMGERGGGRKEKVRRGEKGTWSGGVGRREKGSGREEGRRVEGEGEKEEGEGNKVFDGYYNDVCIPHTGAGYRGIFQLVSVVTLDTLTHSAVFSGNDTISWALHAGNISTSSDDSVCTSRAI